jgi:O-antigen ligase
MTTMTIFRAAAFDRQALERLADWLAVAVAVSLPWSTTATGILVAAWLLVVLPTLELAAIRRELATAAGGLPVLLCALGAAGMLWGDVSWSERLHSFVPFARLLVIPLLLAQFRRSERGIRVFLGFLLSVTGVLLFSWLLVLFPSLPWHTNAFGVPVKDYILQSDDFLICAFALFAIVFDRFRAGRWLFLAGSVALAVLFLANIVFVVTSRTALLVAPVLALLLGWRRFRWKGLVAAAILSCIFGATATLTSPYLHARMATSVAEFHAFEASDAPNSTSFHLEFLKKSLSFVEAAPVIGHGTGSIGEQFRDSAIGETGAAAESSVNPHNQIFAVAIQLGLVGAGALVAMWVAQFILFRGADLTAWIGIIVVTQNVVSSLVNSHLFDFTQAWLYIFGVGVAGGIALKKGGSSPSAAFSCKATLAAGGSS